MAGDPAICISPARTGWLLLEVFLHAVGANLVAFIESAPFFFLSTATPDSVDCSVKGGAPGFVKILSDNVIAWPDYDGNRQYRSLGNIVSSARVGLLFIRFDAEAPGRSIRLRVNGRAEIDESNAASAGTPGAKRLVRVTADHIFPNCPRYIPNLALAEPSVYIPQAGKIAPEPTWKSLPFAKDIFDAEAKSRGEA